MAGAPPFSVIFPFSSPAGPSKYALFQWKTKRQFAYDGSLPVRVNAQQYDEAVLPVLQDESLRADLPINNITLCQGANVDHYINRIAYALVASFTAAGF